MTFEGAITAVGNIVPSTMDAIGRLFPGVSLGSMDRAKSRSVKRALRDMEIVKDIGNEKGMSQEGVDALCSAIAKERIGCDRLSNVISFTAELGPDILKVDEIDPSWAEAFRDYAERAVDEEAQRTWAAILAGEMDRPGSVSKRTMSILSDMGRAEAESFNSLCSQCLGGSLGNGCFVEPIPLLLEGVGDRRMEQVEIDALNALGLTDVHMQGVVVESGYPFDGHGVLVAPIGGIDYRIERGRDTPPLALSKFTRYGVELSSCCDVGGAPGFREAAISWLEGTGAKVMRIVKWNDDGSYDYEYDDEK